MEDRLKVEEHAGELCCTIQGEQGGPAGADELLQRERAGEERRLTGHKSAMAAVYNMLVRCESIHELRLKLHARW